MWSTWFLDCALYTNSAGLSKHMLNKIKKEVLFLRISAFILPRVLSLLCLTFIILECHYHQEDILTNVFLVILRFWEEMIWLVYVIRTITKVHFRLFFCFYFKENFATTFIYSNTYLHCCSEYIIRKNKLINFYNINSNSFHPTAESS